MSASDKKRTSERAAPKKETGILAERVDLSSPQQNPNEQAEPDTQTLLPHERDQTTKPTSTSQPTSSYVPTQASAR